MLNEHFVADVRTGGGRWIIGIDPGLGGAIAQLQVQWDGARLATSLWYVHDMPLVQVGTKRIVDSVALGQALRGPAIQSRHAHAVVERVHAMPGQGVTSMFNFGRALGVVEGALAGLGVPYSLVTPQAWRKRVGLTGGKGDARELARKLCGEQYGKLFARVKDDGRAEATLMALAAAHWLEEELKREENT